MPIHWYLAANLRIVIYNGEMVLTDDRATVGGIVDSGTIVQRG